MKELRRCLGCGTKYEPIPELYMGGPCPHCDSRSYEQAVENNYVMPEIPIPGPKPEPPLRGSTEDYNG